MSDSLTEKMFSLTLRLLLLRGLICFLSILALFLLPEPYGVIILIIALYTFPRFTNRIRQSGEELRLTEKHIYLSANVVWAGVLLALLAHWALRLNNRTASLIAVVTACAILIVFLVNGVNLYQTRPYGLNDKAKLVFLVACITLFIAALEWLLHFGSQGKLTASSPALDRVSAMLLLGFTYFCLLLNRRRLFPSVSWFLISVTVFIFACLFMGLLVAL
jgi:hypothetical protein